MQKICFLNFNLNFLEIEKMLFDNKDSSFMWELDRRHLNACFIAQTSLSFVLCLKKQELLSSLCSFISQNLLPVFAFTPE